MKLLISLQLKSKIVRSKKLLVNEKRETKRRIERNLHFKSCNISFAFLPSEKSNKFSTQLVLSSTNDLDEKHIVHSRALYFIKVH